MTPRENQFCKEAFNHTLTTGEVISHFEEGQRSPELRSALINLLGGDPERYLAGRALASVSTRYDDLSKYFTDVFLEGLNGLTRKDAIRFYSLLPRTLTPKTVLPDCQEEAEELIEAGHCYLGTALWLLNWQKGDRYSTLLMQQLKLETEEKRAWVSRLRMQLCDYMAIHDTHPYIKDCSPAALWLLVEISICRNRLSDRYMEGSKNKRYKRMQKIYSRLDSTDPDDKLPDRKPKDVKDLVENFHGFFMYRVKKMSEEKPDFDSILFAQYMKAEKIWGRAAKAEKGASAYL